MSVFILTLSDMRTGVPRLTKNLGVFQKRSGAYSFILNEKKRGNILFNGGRFGFIDLNSIMDMETQIGYNPDKQLIYENDFWVAFAEKATLV